jgi:uncharacterized protein YkwD
VLAALALAGALEARAAPSAALRIARPSLSVPVEDGFPRDGEPADPVSAALLAMINRDRRDHGLGAVFWDEKAAAVARATTRRQIEEQTTGHFLLDGFPPYARLSAGGNFGMGAENVAAFLSDAGRLHDTAQRLALRAEAEMMKETPPHDLHRRTILDPNATHVGLGWALEGGDLRVDEEFTTRRYSRLRLLREGRGASIRVEGRALPGNSIRYVAVARQPVPEAITRREANDRDSYRYPEAQLLLLPTSTPGKAVGIPSVHSIDSGFSGDFSFPFTPDQPGLWTFILYFREKGSAEAKAGGTITLLVTLGTGRGGP